MDSIDLYKDFTPEEIKVLLPRMEGRGNWDRTPEDSLRRSSRSKQVWAQYTEEERTNRIKRTFHTPEKKVKAAVGRKRFIETLPPEKIDEWVSRSFLNKEGKAKRSEAVRQVWADYTKEERKQRLRNSINNEESYSKSSRARKLGPSGAEKELNKILNKNYPDKFGYNGNCELGVKLGKHIPDFVSLEGKKKAILVFGGIGYVHYLDDMKDSKEFYKKNGWNILILWDFEIYAEEVLPKLKDFID